MAIRFNITAPGTSTYAYLNNSGSPTLTDGSGDTDMSWCAWIRRDADTGASHEEALGITPDNSVADATREGVIISSDVPAVMGYGSNYNLNGGSTLAVGTWMFVGRTATSIFQGWRYWGFTTTLTEAGEPTGVTQTLDSITLGRYKASEANQFRGSIAHFRLWTGALLTQSELEAEMVSTTPVHTANLWANYELVADVLDGTSAHRDLTISGSDYSFVAGPTLGGGSSPSNPLSGKFGRLLRGKFG